jgi:DNA-binding MarR family transcriptional regulator
MSRDMKIEDEIKQPNFKSAYHKAFINLIYTAGWLEVRQAQRFKPYGVTLPQYNILRILRGQFPKPATVNLLMERMLDKTSNVSRIIDKLEVKNLVTRKQCETDRRTVDILITDEGLELLKKMDTELDSQPNGFENLTEAEAETLSNLLDKLRD